MSFFSRLLSRSKLSEQDRFARSLLDRIRAAGDTSDIVYDAQQFQLRPRADDGLVLNMRNIYGEFLQATSDAQPRLLDQFVEGWVSVHRRQMPVDFAAARRNVLPVVRPRAYPDFVALQSQIDGVAAPEIPFIVLNDELILGLVYRMPGAVRIVTSEILVGWNVSLYEALELARENLQELGDPLFSSPIVGLHVCEAHDSHDATRLIRRDLVESLHVDGNHVLMAPNRDLLLVTGSDNPAALVIMAMLAELGLDDSRHITGSAFCFRGDELEPWLPNADNELHARFRRLALKSAAQQYADQGALLEQLHDQNGEDVSVAEFAMAEDDEGRPFSQCVWRDGMPQLLPKTERIIFESESGDRLGEAGWTVAAKFARELSDSTGVYPERYQVANLPPNWLHK